MKLNKEIKSYCNNERFRELLSDEYWDREIYKEEGRILGVQEGKTLGIEEGKTLGIQEMVKEMLKNNYSLDDIVKISKLSLKEIEEIKRDFGENAK